MANRALTKPVVYVVFRYNYGEDSPRFGGFIKRLVSSGFMPDAEYKTVALNDVAFVVDKDGVAGVLDSMGQRLFDDASFVYFKSWEKMPEKAATLAVYLQAKGIPFEDHQIIFAGHTKLPQTMRLWAEGIPVVPTLYAPASQHLSIVDLIGEGPYIVKPYSGEKGNDVFKCDDIDAVKRALEKVGKGCLVQPFIANDGDYRVWTYGFEVRGGIFRQAKEGSYVNNTSKGASSHYVTPDELGGQLTRLASKATRATGNAVAGVDILPGRDGKAYVLEVNQGSQIVTGHERELKMQAFGDYMRSRLTSPYKRIKQPTRLQIIGRHVRVNIPEFNIKGILAKVDTGAYQSAIHATDIQEITLEDGQKVLEFRMLEGHSKADGLSVVCQAHDYDIVNVTNTSGKPEKRYRIKTSIGLGGRKMKTPITLTDRSDMMSPLLLGRRFLRGRYMVNVEMSRSAYEESL